MNGLKKRQLNRNFFADYKFSNTEYMWYQEKCAGLDAITAIKKINRELNWPDLANRLLVKLLSLEQLKKYAQKIFEEANDTTELHAEFGKYRLLSYCDSANTILSATRISKEILSVANELGIGLDKISTFGVEYGIELLEE